jgi:GNAT superfamily N-acetyltransferase
MDDGHALPLQDAESLFVRFAQYPYYKLYVAEQERQIVGSFALLIMDNLGHLGAPSAIVEDVVVDPALHGNGIGQAMMRFAMARAGEKNCYKLVLSSNAKRERAHAFYEQLGFERHGYSFCVRPEQVPA